MKITIEKDDGTVVTFEGPNALDELDTYLNTPALPWIPYPDIQQPEFTVYTIPPGQAPVQIW